MDEATEVSNVMLHNKYTFILSYQQLAKCQQKNN